MTNWAVGGVNLLLHKYIYIYWIDIMINTLSFTHKISSVSYPSPFCNSGYYEIVFVHTKHTDRLNITPGFYLTLILRPFINFCWQSIDWNINSIEIKPCTAVYFDPWMMPIQISAHRGSFIYSSKIYVSPDLGFNATCDAFIIRSSCNLIESFLLHLE